MDKLAIINRIKKSYQSVRVANFHPTGIFATRALVFIMLVPILLVIIQYVMSFVSGYVSDEANKLINVGLNIIDHIFIPWIIKFPNSLPRHIYHAFTLLKSYLIPSPVALSLSKALTTSVAFLIFSPLKRVFTSCKVGAFANESLSSTLVIMLFTC